jgi:hypothetical protein
MKITVTPLSTVAQVQRAAEMTTHGQPCKAPMRLWYKTMHSPVRLMRFWIEMEGIPTFVSVHFVRHKIGVEHFVQTMRDDRGGLEPAQVTRLTPVTHGMEINAQALVTMARKRLCYKAHTGTVAVFRKVVKAIGEVDPELPRWLVPECAAIGYCPEFSECKPGVRKVMNAYRESGPMKLRADVE